jgi:cell wall-associated NlpC family hydrolase
MVPTGYLGGGLMRRIIIVVSGLVFASVLVFSLAALSAGAQTAPSQPLMRAKGHASGNDVVREAKSYIGTKYKDATCTKSRMNCTCLTKKVFAKFGYELPMNTSGQWKYERGSKVSKSSLRPGDMVFFKEEGPKGSITHVGIYSGGGNLVHASKYFGKVVESEMKYIKGYFGAKRL